MKIDIVRTECGSGDCELGCYNTGYGGYIMIDGVNEDSIITMLSDKGIEVVFYY